MPVLAKAGMQAFRFESATRSRQLLRAEEGVLDGGGVSIIFSGSNGTYTAAAVENACFRSQ